MRKSLTIKVRSLLAMFSFMLVPVSGVAQTHVVEKPSEISNYAITRSEYKPMSEQVNLNYAAMDINANEKWWGYFNGDYEGNTGLLGVETTGLYNCCVRMFSASEMGKGKTIEGVKFSFPSLNDIDDIYIWISENLPNTPEKADITYQKIDKSALYDLNGTDMKYNEIRFEKPYLIGDNDVYVGYSFNVLKADTDEAKQPMLITKWPETTDKGGLLFYSPEEGWIDCSGYPFGNLAVQMLMSRTDTKNAVSIQRNFDSEIACKKGSETQVTLELKNEGTEGCSQFKYVVSQGSNKYEEQNAVLDNKVDGIDQTFKYTFKIPAGQESGRDTVTVSITSVNGVDNESLGFTTSGGAMYSLSKVVDHNVFVEHFVGTWDGHSPRAYASMEKISDIYGDKVIVASVHAGNEEPMDCADYKEMSYYYKGTTGFPTSFIDRTINDVDPYWGEEILSDFGFNDSFLKLYNQVALADIQINAYIDESGNNIVVDSETEFLCNTDKGEYAVGYLLKENGMTGEGEKWYQANQICDFKGADIFDNDSYFTWWLDQESVVKGYVFNNVVIAAQGMLKKGIEGSLKAPFIENEKQKHTIQFVLSDYPIIQDKTKLQVCAVIFNRANGRIMNSTCKNVTLHNDIQDITNSSDIKEIERYTVSGQRIYTPFKGINIIKYSDGSVRKVLIK